MWVGRGITERRSGKGGLTYFLERGGGGGGAGGLIFLEWERGGGCWYVAVSECTFFCKPKGELIFGGCSKGGGGGVLIAVIGGRKGSSKKQRRIDWG